MCGENFGYGVWGRAESARGRLSGWNCLTLATHWPPVPGAELLQTLGHPWVW